MKTKLLLLLAMSIGLVSSAWAEDVEISNASELVEFAERVNGGETSLNAVLTDDIDLEGVAWTPIGNASNKYAGTFDGKGYAITNFSYTATGDYNGLFGGVINATVKNFSISGTLTSDGFTYNGTIGAAEGNSVISGIYSALNINVANKNAHTGGILGSTVTSGNKARVENCEYSGTLTHSGTGDNQAGILGYTYDGGVFNCIFSGTIIGEGSRYAGILGYCKVPGFLGVQNCLSVGKIVANSGVQAGAIIGNWNGDKTSNVKNNYYYFPEGSTTDKAIGKIKAAGNVTDPVLVTPEQLASGEVCYLLNGDQSNISFYQTLSSDEVPVLDNTHSVVYLAGRSHCDGTPYEGVTGYSNTASVVDEHDFSDGYCTYCDAIDESYSMTPNTDGYYEIGSANQLRWFARFVNGGNYAANAVLTDDIDMNSKPWPKPMGDWASGNVSTAYKGHFDGQGFAITNLNYNASQNYHGLFGVVTEGALIENFSISGEITSNTQYMGVVAYARETPIIRNVHSYLNINNSYGGGRQGGILGGSMNGTVTIDRCWYSGTLNAGELSGNYGGIVGYVNNNAAAIINITNCLFDGELNNGTVGGQCGGVVGYNNGGYATITNCLSIGTLTSGAAGQFFGALNGNNSTYVNCYYTGIAPQTGSGKPKGKTPVEVTTEQLTSGEVAYKLGEAWGQLLDADPYPTPSYDVKVNYVGEAGYSTMYDETSGYELIGDVKAYVAVSEKTWLKLTEIEGGVPENTPVILKGTYYNKKEVTLPALNIANELKGTATDTEADGSMYILAENEGVVGFYQATGTIPAGKAYYQSAAGVKAFFFAEEDGETAINSLTPALSEGEGAIFNIAGQKLSKLQKGINIVNGKKVLF